MKNNTINGQSAAKPLLNEERSTTIETTLAKDKGVEYISSDGKGRDLRIVYIYALAEPGTDIIRYIGKTVDLKNRLTRHLSETSKTYKNNWIKSLNGIKPEVIILDECDEDNWIDCEKYWISQCKTWGFKLTNLTEGGEGMCGLSPSAESIAKTVLKTTGQKRSLETCLRISESKKGVKFSDKHIENLKLSHKGKAPKTTKRFKKPIIQLKDNVIIKEWGSIKEASLFYNVNHSSISRCCSGSKKTVKGYTWKYL